MSTVILRGEDAIHFAEIHHLHIHKDADAHSGPRDDVSPEEAHRLALADPDALWVEAHVAVNTGDPDDADMH